MRDQPPDFIYGALCLCLDSNWDGLLWCCVSDAGWCRSAIIAWWVRVEVLAVPFCCVAVQAYQTHARR